MKLSKKSLKKSGEKIREELLLRTNPIQIFIVGAIVLILSALMIPHCSTFKERQVDSRPSEPIIEIIQ